MNVIIILSLHQFSIYRALFNIFHPSGLKGLRTPNPYKSFVATPHTCFRQSLFKTRSRMWKKEQIVKKKEKHLFYNVDMQLQKNSRPLFHQSADLLLARGGLTFV